MLAENEPVASKPEGEEPETNTVAGTEGSTAEEGREEKRRRGRRAKEKESPEAALFDAAARRLQICGRCSTLWAECRAKLGQEILEVAHQALGRDKEWLVLPWEPEVRAIVEKSYATPDDHEYYYFDSHCPECGRRFFYHVHPIAETPPSFRLRL
jgi:hypothetical protein